MITVETLKENRDLVINTIANDYGTDNVKKVMQAMLNMVSLAESTNIEDYIVEVAEETLDLVKKGTITHVDAQNYFENEREKMRNIYSRKGY
jgi:metal-responsive CopG/Arc/MetJ family transcriptional regulator